jgi:predicted dehydrogenase
MNMDTMTQNLKVRVGLVGCGNIGLRAHLRTCLQLPETEVVAVCDIVEERAQEAAGQSGARPYTDYRQLLEQKDLDMVIVATPNDLHAEMTIAAAEAGKHVLCEKPMAHTLSAAEAMIEAAKTAGVKVMIGQTRHFDHRYVSIKEQLDAGKVGRPVFIRHSARQFLPFPPDGWQWDPARGGGVFLNISIHATDLFRWFFGEDAVEVFTVAKSVRESARAAGCYDHAFITCKFEGGGVGFTEPSWVYPGDFGGTLYAQLDVVGTAGKIQYADKDTNPLLTYTAGKGHELARYFRFMSTTEYAFEEEIRHFARCVLEDREPIISLQHARAALEITLAAQRSAQTGQPVRLPLE